MLVKCHGCGISLEKANAIHEGGHYWDAACIQDKRERSQLYATICRIFHLKAPGPRIYAQIKNFTTNNGYTIKGIENALVYFFDIKQNSIEKANNGIGIVPYIYEEAKQYFEIKEKQRDRVAKGAAKFKKEIRTVTLTDTTEEKKKDIFDLNDL